jgi:hypothetical protein
VWDRPWLNLREVNHVSCSSAAENRVKRVSTDVPVTEQINSHLHELLTVSFSVFNCSLPSQRSWIGGGSHDIHIGLFDEFVNKYNKHYQSKAEYKRRFHIFRANMKKVERLQKTEQGTAVYGATQFADLTC